MLLNMSGNNHFFKLNLCYLFSFQQRPKRRNDIALIKVKTHYPDHRVMPICQVEPELGTILGSCGLGSTSAPKLTIPTHIQEVFFYESMFENIDPFNFEVR